MRARVAILLACAALLSSCGEDVARASAARDVLADAWFSEEALQRGLDFEQRSGHDGKYLFPEILGAGAGLFDMDADGDLDAYLVQAGSLLEPDEGAANQLFANDGAGHFTDVSRGSGAQDRGYGMGVASGDCDGDADVDLYVTNLEANVLLVGDGAGRFEDRGRASGTDQSAWSVSAAFLDDDRDGDLDLFVTNYVYWRAADEVRCEVPPLGEDYCSPKAYGAPAPDTLYRNRGTGVFDDVSAAAGLRSAFGNGLGVVVADFDEDGWSDVFVANDGTLNQMWINAGDGTFEDRALALGCAADEDGAAKAGMGVAVVDIDGDLDEDLLVVNLATESDSYYQNEKSYFSDRTALLGLAGENRRNTRFGCGFFDFDHDGRLDLFEANGRVARSEDAPAGDPYAEVNRLYRGGPGGRLLALPGDGTRAPLAATSRAAAFGDVNADGGVDILVANRDGRAQLYINQRAGNGGWIRLRVLEASGAPALGAVVRARVGERSVVRRVRTAYSYAAANEPEVHLGLGTAQGVRDVRVQWIDGTIESFGDFEANRTQELLRGKGAQAPR